MSDNKFSQEFTNFIRKIHQTDDFISLHEPSFSGNEKAYVLECIDSTYVSSVGEYVDKFEKLIAEYTGSQYAIATVNGTAALHTALLVAGVESGNEVITQAVSFVATTNAISYCNAEPIFLDSDIDTLGLNPLALQNFLTINTEQRDDGYTYNLNSGKKIVACIPMHVFGHPTKIDQIQTLCNEYNITLIEDAAESFGSLYKKRHAGTFGELGILSFNGNKIITSGGGGIILTNNRKLANMAKHFTTTAKIDHQWEYAHDQVGYNYRMPNLNAALGCAQVEQIDEMLQSKRKLADSYQEFFTDMSIKFVSEPENCQSNYWLNAIIMDSLEERNKFLQFTNDNGIMTRPMWKLLPELPMYAHCQTDELKNARWLQDRIINIPSSVN